MLSGHLTPRTEYAQKEYKLYRHAHEILNAVWMDPEWETRAAGEKCGPKKCQMNNPLIKLTTSFSFLHFDNLKWERGRDRKRNENMTKNK